MAYRGSRGSFSYPTSPVTPRAASNPYPVSPRSIHSNASRSSLRSAKSVAWESVVDAILSAEPNRDSQLITEEDLAQYQPPIAEDIEEEDSSPPGINGPLRDGPVHSAQPSMDASTIVNGYSTEQGSIRTRRASGLSVPASVRASRASYTNFDFDTQSPDNLDMTLKVPEEADLADAAREYENLEENTDDDRNEKTEDAEKETRLSRVSSHSGSGSSTVHEQLDEAPTSKDEPVADDLEACPEGPQPDEAPQAPFSAFPTKAKRFIVLSAASASVFAPLSMQIYLPSLTTLVTVFGVSRSAINLTVSVYMIFMAISPMIIGGVADVVGRRPAMLACFSLYMVSCIMIALCHTYKELMGFRILQSIGASPLIAIASAVVADIVTSAERGSYAALVALPVIFAPTLGPVIGGLLTQYLGWRSIFWFLLIVSAFGTVMIAVFFPETCRFIVGDASAKSPKRYRSVMQSLKDKKPEFSQSAADEKARLRGQHTPKKMLWMSLTSAVRILFTKERFFLLVYVGLIFSGFQAIATELPTQFKAIYGYDSVMIGVMYLPLAGGAIISTALFGKQMNNKFRKYAARAGISLEDGQEVDMNRINVERARLEVTLPPMLLSIAGIVCWGWVLERRTTIAAPCVLLFFMGVGLNGVMATTNALLMDISQAQAGAVMAASNLTRCAIGAVASACVDLMIQKMGLGWTYVVFGVIFFVCSPMILVHFFKGHQWRMQAKVKADRKQAGLALEGNTEQALDGNTEQVTETGVVQAAAVDAVVNTPAIALVELKTKEKSGGNTVSSEN